jgi:hypothetical protein
MECLLVWICSLLCRWEKWLVGCTDWCTSSWTELHFHVLCLPKLIFFFQTMIGSFLQRWTSRPCNQGVTMSQIILQ